MMYKYYYFIVLNFVFTEDYDNHCPSYENIFRIFCAGLDTETMKILTKNINVCRSGVNRYLESVSTLSFSYISLTHIIKHRKEA